MHSLGRAISLISSGVSGQLFRVANGSAWGQQGIAWFALETNRDHSVVFEIASKYCISDSFVDHDGYSISSEGFLPAVVDIMVI